MFFPSLYLQKISLIDRLTVILFVGFWTRGVIRFLPISTVFKDTERPEMRRIPIFCHNSHLFFNFSIPLKAALWFPRGSHSPTRIFCPNFHLSFSFEYLLRMLFGFLEVSILLSSVETVTCGFPFGYPYLLRLIFRFLVGVPILLSSVIAVTYGFPFGYHSRPLFGFLGVPTRFHLFNCYLF